jgi:hypothetical protein
MVRYAIKFLDGTLANYYNFADINMELPIYRMCISFEPDDYVYEEGVYIPEGVVNVEIFDYNFNIPEMPKLPDSLEYLMITGTNIKQLGPLPPNLIHLNIGFPHLTEEEADKYFDNTILPPRLNFFGIHSSKFKKCPRLPTNIRTINLYGCSGITRLPENILECRAVNEVNYFNVPLELSTQEINFMEIVKERWGMRIRREMYGDEGYMNDRQNVHNSSVQKSLRDSVAAIMNF